MEFFKKIFLTGAILMLGACSSTRMNYAESIEMDAYPAPNSQGANRHLPENSTGSRLRGGVIGGFTDRVKLDAVHNTGDRDTLDVDARYKIKYLPIYGSIDKFVKGELFTMNIGFGINHGIYASTGFGINTRFFELGVNSFQRFTYQRLSFLAYEKKSKDEFEKLEAINDNKLVFQYGVGGFAGLFIGPITLGYNGSVYRPNMSLVINEPNPRFCFKTPFMFTNNFYVSYWYTDLLEFQAGVSNELIDFNGGNWSLNAGVSIWSF